METNLLDRMLHTYLTGRIPVAITLQNKIRVFGKIKAFDSYVIIMEGQKREIVYRHAVSCLSPLHQDEQKKSAARPETPQGRPVPRPVKSPDYKSRPQRQTLLSVTSPETSINNGMKEGLLKWMQEQKAAK